MAKPDEQNEAEMVANGAKSRYPQAGSGSGARMYLGIIAGGRPDEGEAAAFRDDEGRFNGSQYVFRGVNVPDRIAPVALRRASRHRSTDGIVTASPDVTRVSVLAAGFAVPRSLESGQAFDVADLEGAQ